MASTKKKERYETDVWKKDTEDGIKEGNNNKMRKRKIHTGIIQTHRRKENKDMKPKLPHTLRSAG